jgi:hypothetical protein
MNLSGKHSEKTAIIWRKEWESTREWTASEDDMRVEEERYKDKGEDEKGRDAEEAAALNEEGKEGEERTNEESW